MDNMGGTSIVVYKTGRNDRRGGGGTNDPT